MLTCHIYYAGKTLYRDWNRVVEFLLQLENKQQTMPNKVETQSTQAHVHL